MSAAGPPQGAKAPMGGSKPRAAGSVGARFRHALTHSLRVRLVALFLLLALAMTGGTPAASRAGNEKKVPPPAMAFMPPARKAPAPTRSNSVVCIVDGLNGVKIG